jgi:thioredoxin reductase (NADPH)
MSHPKLDEGTQVLIIGHRWSPRVHELKAFLARSRVPYRWLDIEHDDGVLDVAERTVPGIKRFPIVLFPDGSFCL